MKPRSAPATSSFVYSVVTTTSDVRLMENFDPENGWRETSLSHGSQSA
jgi:hypothetical protein